MQSGWDSLPAYLTLRQVAELFGVHPNTVRNWDRSGRLRSVRISSRGDRRYDKEAVYRIFREEYSRVEGRILTNGAPNGSATNSVAADAPPSTVGPPPARRRIPFLARLRARLTDRRTYRRWNRIRVLASSAPRRRIAALPSRRALPVPAVVVSGVLGVVVLATVGFVVARSPLVHREPPGASTSSSSAPVAAAGTDRTFDVRDSEVTSPHPALPAVPVTIAANDQPDIVIGGGEASASGEAGEPAPTEQPIADAASTPNLVVAEQPESQPDSIATTRGENREVVVGGAKPVGIEPSLPPLEVQQPETVVEPGSAPAIAAAAPSEVPSTGVVAGASEVASTAPPAPPNPAVPVGVPKIPANPVGMALAWISLTFGSFFFIYSFRYYSIVAVVLALSRSGVPGNGYANGNGKNGNGIGNGYRNGYGNGKWNGNGYRNGNGNETARGAKGFLAGFFKKNGAGKGFRPGFTGLANGNGARPRHPSFLFNLFFGDESAEKANGRNGTGNGYANGNGYTNGKNGQANGNGQSGYRTGYFGANGKNGRGNGNGNGNGRWNGNGKAAYARFFQGLFKKNGNGYRNGNGRNGNGYRNGNGNGHAPVGMWWDLSGVELEKLPFVSVHIPFYNEKKVANRILTACTSFDYPNYEVIVVDDSTDETVQILEKWKRHPKVKVIHRNERTGFKGGALKQAVAQMDPRSAFVVVFDADFVPYPDTLTQFLRYFRVGSGHTEDYKSTNLAAVQGYQWHVLNKNENWITRAVRAEFAGSYVIERPGTEIFGALKQIAGSVYMIRADVLKKYGWGTSITEDFELTLKLYTDGYRVLYTPYVQGPSECVSTLKRLIRQRMRWAEGHTHNVRKSFRKILASPYLRKREKAEFLYLAPYYLQAAFFVVGTLAWFVSDAVMHTRLPFWTELWGWSLVFTNLFALPLVNAVGLFLEESPQRDYLGIFSFVLLSYVLVPFQAWAALKGLVEKSEGPWFRTPKSGHITDAFFRSRFRRWFGSLFPGATGNRALAAEQALALNPYLARPSAHDGFRKFGIPPSPLKWIGNAAFTLVVGVTAFVVALSPVIPLNLQLVAASENRTIVGLDDAEQAEPITGQLYAPFSDSEVIFHREPRVRFKNGDRELEVTTRAAGGLGRAQPSDAYREGPLYVYPKLFPDTDLLYRVWADSRVDESLRLNQYHPLEYFEQKVRMINVVAAVDPEGALRFADPRTGGAPLFSAEAPYLYEEGNPEVRSTGVRFEIVGDGEALMLRKTLTEEGRQWLADPTRQFPVVLDPSVVRSEPLTTGYVAAEAEYGSNQRKVAYSATAAAWYVVLADGDIIQYKKCAISTNCDADGDWGSAVNVNGTNASSFHPTLYLSGASLYFFWFADYNPFDRVKFVALNTSNDSFGTICTSADQGTLSGATTYVFGAVAGGGDVVMGYDNIGTDAEEDIFEVDTGGCTFTSILTGSGYPTDDPAAGHKAVAVAHDGNLGAFVVSIVYDDGANVINHSIYDTDANAWVAGGTDKAADEGNVLNKTFSVTTDGGTNLWLLYEEASEVFRITKCSGASCAGGSGAWTTGLTNPFSGTTENTVDPNLTYLSTASDLRACILEGPLALGSREVHCQNSDATTLSWSAGKEADLDEVSGIADAHGNLSTPMSVVANNQMAILVNNTTDSSLEFASALDQDPIHSYVVYNLVAAVEAQFGSNARRIAYMPNATGGAAWYVFHADGDKVQYKKCKPSLSCDNYKDWSANVNVDVDGDLGDTNPNIWVDNGSNRILVAWVDYATAGTSACCDTTETIQMRELNTASSDAWSSECSSASQGTLETTAFAYIAAPDIYPATGTDFLVGYSSTAGDAEADLFEATHNWTCAAEGTGLTSIESASGMPASSTTMRPVAVATKGEASRVMIVYDDAANEIRSSAYHLTDNVWTYTDKVADNGAVFDDVFSVGLGEDNSAMALLYRDTSTTTVLQECDTTCQTTSGGAWTNDTAPWTSGLTSAESPTLSLFGFSTDIRVAACIIDGSAATTQNIKCKDGNGASMTWGAEYDLSYSLRDYAELSSTYIAVGTSASTPEDRVGVVLFDATNGTLRFSTLPENLLALLFLSPLLPGALARLRRARRHIKSTEWKT